MTFPTRIGYHAAHDEATILKALHNLHRDGNAEDSKAAAVLIDALENDTWVLLTTDNPNE